MINRFLSWEKKKIEKLLIRETMGLSLGKSLSTFPGEITPTWLARLSRVPAGEFAAKGRGQTDQKNQRNECWVASQKGNERRQLNGHWSCFIKLYTKVECSVIYSAKDNCLNINRLFKIRIQRPMKLTKCTYLFD